MSIIDDMDNAPPTKSQAKRVFEKFGGVPNLREALLAVAPHRKWAISGIYKWDLPKDRQGTGGVVPAQSMRWVIAAAQHEGVLLTPDDLYPDQNPMKG